MKHKITPIERIFHEVVHREMSPSERRVLIPATRKSVKPKHRAKQKDKS